VVLNAANEMAVELFLAEQIDFLEIAKIVKQTVEEHPWQAEAKLADLLSLDDWARKRIKEMVKK